MSTHGPRRSPVLDAKRLWAGGAATAVVAALIAVVGLLVVRGLLNIEFITPGLSIGDSQVTTLVGWAVVTTLVATALLHLLLVSTPRARSFFGWIAMLATVAAALWPFTIYTPNDSRIASSLVYLLTGIAVTTLLSGVADSARRSVPIAP